MIIDLCMNYFEATHMIQSKIGAQHNFKHLIQLRLYFRLREPLKNPQNTRDHITKVTKGYTYLTNPQLKVAGLFKPV